jgi:hypothetical protein
VAFRCVLRTLTYIIKVIGIVGELPQRYRESFHFRNDHTILLSCQQLLLLTGYMSVSVSYCGAITRESR